MIDLSLMQDHPTIAPRVRWVDDLNELYCHTKAAQAQAERHGFEGMAAALADMAATLACKPGVNPTVVRALADTDPTSRTSAPSLSKPHGGLVTRH